MNKHRDKQLIETQYQFDFSTVQQRFVMEGIVRVKVTGMRDSLVLLLESEAGAVARVAKAHEMWWRGIFLSVKKWSPQCVAGKRRLWLKVFGIPLHVWDEELFKAIGNFFSEFLDFDEDIIGRRRLDFARINVRTSRRGLIDEEIRIRVMGAVHKLWVVEEFCGGEGWQRAVNEDEDDLQSVGSRDDVIPQVREKEFLVEVVGPEIGVSVEQKEGSRASFYVGMYKNEGLVDLGLKSQVRIGQVPFVQELSSGVQPVMETEACAAQVLVGQRLTSLGPPVDCLVEFPPLEKTNGHGLVLLRRATKSLDNYSHSDGHNGAVVSDSFFFFITNKVDLIHKGVQFKNKHIRFKDDFDGSDMSDSIEDFADEEERMLKLKKKLRLKKQTLGPKGRKDVLANSASTPPSGIALIIQDHDEVVPETQDDIREDINLDVLAKSKIEAIPQQDFFGC